MRKLLFLLVVFFIGYGQLKPEKDLSSILFPELAKQLNHKMVFPSYYRSSFINGNYTPAIPLEYKRVDMFKNIEVDFILSYYKNTFNFFELNKD